MQAVVLSIALFSCLPVFNAQNYKVVYKGKLSCYISIASVSSSKILSSQFDRIFKAYLGLLFS